MNSYLLFPSICVVLIRFLCVQKRSKKHTHISLQLCKHIKLFRHILCNQFDCFSHQIQSCFCQQCIALRARNLVQGRETQEAQVFEESSNVKVRLCSLAGLTNRRIQASLKDVLYPGQNLIKNSLRWIIIAKTNCFDFCIVIFWYNWKTSFIFCQFGSRMN